MHADALLRHHRLGHLATADAGGEPSLVPVCYAYDGRAIYTAIDHKPKRREGAQLKRVRNILQNPRVAFLVDHYDEDWSQLYYVLVRGRAALVSDPQERQYALGLLEEKYVQYREAKLAQGEGLVLRITLEQVRLWRWPSGEGAR